MGFQFSGIAKFIRRETFITKGGKEIVTAVFDIPDAQYPQMVPIKMFGRCAKDCASWTPGDMIQVDGHLGGKEYNGKVYGDAVADMVSAVAPLHQKAAGRAPAGPPPDDDIAF